MSRLTDTEALEQAARALDVYIQDVRANVQKMRTAADNCSDNMGSDDYSRRAIDKLEECITSLNSALQVAESLEKQILATKMRIEETEVSW